ncbi:MAG: winged helix-turn-helix domain-containing protein [Phenylobacterium sp.]
MSNPLDVASVAALVGDPARANMLASLMTGRALTATELAQEAGVTPQTASAHLAKLQQGGLLTLRKQGRHAYFALAGADVASLIETLMGLAEASGHHRVRTGPREPALRRARVCYDHLAGELGVAMLDGLIATGRIVDDAGSLSLTHKGRFFAEDFGLPKAAFEARRPVCKACLDWSVRRSHLAGALGQALLDGIYARAWARRVPDTRIVAFSAAGLAAFEKAFGIERLQS